MTQLQYALLSFGRSLPVRFLSRIPPADAVHGRFAREVFAPALVGSLRWVQSVQWACLVPVEGRAYQIGTCGGHVEELDLEDVELGCLSPLFYGCHIEQPPLPGAFDFIKELECCFPPPRETGFSYSCLYLGSGGTTDLLKLAKPWPFPPL